MKRTVRKAIINEIQYIKKRVNTTIKKKVKLSKKNE